MLSKFLRIIKFSLIIIKAQGIQISLTKDRGQPDSPDQKTDTRIYYLILE